MDIDQPDPTAAVTNTTALHLDDTQTAVPPLLHPSSQHKKKKKNKRKKSQDEIEHRYTIKNPSWGYLHLKVISSHSKPKSKSTSSVPIDLLTWRSYLTSIANQFLGISGQAIPIDILHLDNDCDEAYIRMPKDCLRSMSSAISGWSSEEDESSGRMVSIRVLNSSEFLMGIVDGTNGGKELFL